MAMRNSPHPGESITGFHLVPNAIHGRELADNLDVVASTPSRVFEDSVRVTPGMALPGIHSSRYRIPARLDSGRGP